MHKTDTRPCIFFFGKAIAVVLFVGRKVGLARIDSGQSTEHEGLGD